MDNVIKAIGSAVRGLRNKIQSTLSESKSYTDSKASSTLSESKSYTDAKVKEGLPAVSALDNGKFLRVSNGKWAAEAVPNAEDGEY